MNSLAVSRWAPAVALSLLVVAWLFIYEALIVKQRLAAMVDTQVDERFEELSGLHSVYAKEQREFEARNGLKRIPHMERGWELGEMIMDMHLEERPAWILRYLEENDTQLLEKFLMEERREWVEKHVPGWLE